VSLIKGPSSMGWRMAGGGRAGPLVFLCIQKSQNTYVHMYYKQPASVSCNSSSSPGNLTSNNNRFPSPFFKQRENETLCSLFDYFHEKRKENMITCFITQIYCRTYIYEERLIEIAGRFFKITEFYGINSLSKILRWWHTNLVAEVSNAFIYIKYFVEQFFKFYDTLNMIRCQCL
jgi:hypothetical protein